MSGPPPFPEKGLRGLVVHPAGVVDARRDLHVFLRYVRERGLRRTVRTNEIPKTDARRLAKLMSRAGEGRELREIGRGPWADHVSWLAREMGLVSFDKEGVYLGYSSTSASYPDNDVEICEKPLRKYLSLSPVEKERTILASHLSMVGSEFFRPALLLPIDTFDSFGCATGPAGRMDLPAIRRSILGYLAGLEPGVWYDLPGTVADFGHLYPRLILSSSEGTGNWDSGDLYRNFREYPAGKSRIGLEPRRITTDTPRAFFLVEGRYLEYFLRGIPYLLGFVSLAERPPEDPHGLDVTPPRERIRAFRVTERLVRIVGGDPEFGEARLTVLPNFEIILEAASYPESVLAELEPFAEPLSEQGPVHRLKITRDRVVRSVAESPEGLDPIGKLESLSTGPIPSNVAAELVEWSRRGGSFTIYEGHALLESRGDAERRRAIRALANLVEEADAGGFALVRQPEAAFARLEQAGLVPVEVKHGQRKFAPAEGRLGAVPASGPKKQRKEPRPKRIRAKLSNEDLVACRSDCPELIEALAAELGGTAQILEDGRLLVPAASLPDLRKALRRLGKRFCIDQL